MNELILVGGAKGVGKTSVLSTISKRLPIQITNTGEIFTNARERKQDPEKAIFDFLMNYNGIVDTHYAGYQGEGFVRGLSSVYLRELKKTKEVEVVLIDLNIEDLIERRRKDSRERIKDLGHMEKELEMNRTYFRQYCEDLLTQGYVIFNRDLETCVSELLEIVK